MGVIAVPFVLALVGAAPADAGQDRRIEALYEAAVVAFRADGDLTAARRLVDASTPARIDAAVVHLRAASPQLVAPASLMHLEMALASVEADADRALREIRFGERLLTPTARTLPASPGDFIARWSVVASSVFQARTDVARARATLAFGLDHRPGDAGVRLAAGVIEDLASLLSDDGETSLGDRRQTAVRRNTYRLMAAAEREYRAVLANAPDHAAARLRLGRILYRRGRLTEARQELERAGAADLAAGERYLLDLFLSATHEALGNQALARAAALDAVRVAGDRQGAWLALSQFEERAGHPERARGVIAQSVTRGARADDDEWWHYRHGGLDTGGLAWLRQHVRSLP